MAIASGFLAPASSTMLFAVALLVALIAGALMFGTQSDGKPTWHELVEGNAVSFTTLTIVAVLIGGLAEIVPAVVVGQVKLAATRTRPYDALELEGRDVFLKEGCYNCHSQMIRPFVWESARYGDRAVLHVKAGDEDE